LSAVSPIVWFFTLTLEAEKERIELVHYRPEDEERILAAIRSDEPAGTPAAKPDQVKIYPAAAAPNCSETAITLA
jgi:hypothetical protein